MLRSDITKIELTPELAAFWLEHYSYRGNRNVTERDVEKMKRVHLRGEFPETEAIHCTVRGSDNRNLDSQHRCRMVIETGKPLSLNLKQFDAPGEKERRMLWKGIDRGRGRKFGQAIHADEWQEAGYRNKTDMQCVGATLELIEGKFTVAAANLRNTASFEERSDFAFHWSEPARVLFDAMAGAPNLYTNLLTRRTVMAVLLPLCDRGADPAAMVTLVHRLAYNEGLAPKTAAHRLMMELQKSGSNLRGKAAVEFMRKVAYCCVRHIEGKPCREIPSDVPVKLPGSGMVIG